jgi:hypothetical protein
MWGGLTRRCSGRAPRAAERQTRYTKMTEINPKGTPDELRLAEIRSRVKLLQQEHMQLIFMDDVFWQVNAVIRANEELAKGGIFQRWITRRYVESVAIGVRRMVGEANGALCIPKLLNMIIKERTGFTRYWFVNSKSEDHRESAQKWFDDLAGEGAIHLSKKRVLQILAGLDSASNDIENYCNNEIAHKSEAELDPSDSPTFVDVRRCLARIFKVLEWCEWLVESVSHGPAVAWAAEEWKDVFTFPWLPKGSEFPQHESIQGLVDSLDFAE